MWSMHCLAQCAPCLIRQSTNALRVCLLEQAVPCYSIAQCTPCYAGMQSLHVLPGCLHVACCLHTCFPMQVKTLYFASVQSLHVSSGCLHVACCLHTCFPMYKKNSMFCLDAITTCIAGCCLIMLSSELYILH
jgi:hypothetical protein